MCMTKAQVMLDILMLHYIATDKKKTRERDKGIKWTSSELIFLIDIMNEAKGFHMLLQINDNTQNGGGDILLWRIAAILSILNFTTYVVVSLDLWQNLVFFRIYKDSPYHGYVSIINVVVASCEKYKQEKKESNVYVPQRNYLDILGPRWIYRKNLFNIIKLWLIRLCLRSIGERY
jgi:hypothetical protein